MAAGQIHQDETGTWFEDAAGDFHQLHHDAQGRWWFNGPNGQLHPVPLPGEQEYQAWAGQTLERLEALEEDLGRPLTSDESTTIIQDLMQKPADQQDATWSYLENFEVDRTSDEDDRRDLMDEIMDDVDAGTDAYVEPSGEAGEDWE